MKRLFTVATFLLSIGAASARANTEEVSRPAGVPDGRWAIVVAAEATETEQTVALELCKYLRQICGEWFEIQPEANHDGNSPAIYVGPTTFARGHGCKPEAMAEEEFVIQHVKDSLILCGGRPRGTFYAVIQFLEEFCGVRWLTLFGEEYVPQRPALNLPDVNRHMRPAFVDRDLMAPRCQLGPSGWYDKDAVLCLDRMLAFGRINGKASSLHLASELPSNRYGGHIRGNQIAHNIWVFARICG